MNRLKAYSRSTLERITRRDRVTLLTSVILDPTATSPPPAMGNRTCIPLLDPPESEPDLVENGQKIVTGRRGIARLELHGPPLDVDRAHVLDTRPALERTSHPSGRPLAVEVVDAEDHGRGHAASTGAPDLECSTKHEPESGLQGQGAHPSVARARIWKGVTERARRPRPFDAGRRSHQVGGPVADTPSGEVRSLRGAPCPCP